MTFAGITIRKGDDYSHALTLTDEDGDALNITGCTLTFHLRLPGADEDAIDPAPTLALTTPASGVATLTLTDTQTGTLAGNSDYRYWIALVDGLGNVSTPVDGIAFVEGQG